MNNAQMRGMRLMASAIGINTDFSPREITITHGDWYQTLIDGESVSYYDTILPARQSAQARGYRFGKIEKIDGRTVEVEAFCS